MTDINETYLQAFLFETSENIEQLEHIDVVGLMNKTERG